MNSWRRPDRDHPATDYANMDGGLRAALEAGDRRTLERLSDEFFDFNQTYAHGKTALHWAVETGNTQGVRLLLEYGASPDTVDDYRRSPLIMAADTLHEDCALALLSGGADPAQPDNVGNTPLHIGVSAGLERLVTALLDNPKTPVDVYNDGKILPIHTAAGRDNLNILKALLTRGADPNLKDHAGRTALHIAAGGGRGDAVLMMVRHGGDLDAIDMMGVTPMGTARKAGKIRHMAPVFSQMHTNRVKRAWRKRHQPRPAA